MKKILVLSSLVLAASLVAAPLAYAQTTLLAPTCGEALLALADAQTKHRVATDADKAAADATAADTALADAPAVVVPDTATTDAATISADKVTTQNRADINTALTASIAADNAANLTADSALTVQLKAALVAAGNSLKLQAEAKADAVALRRVGGETDATVLKTKVDEARAAADKACAASTTTPPTTTPPVTPPSTPPFADLDCTDFATPAAAQAKLDEDRSDPHGLDANHNGIACEVVDNSGDGFSQVGDLPAAIDTGRA